MHSLLADVANTTLQSGADSLGAAVARLYAYALSIVGLAVFIMFLLAGISYILPDRFKSAWMQKPNVMIIDAVIGFILLISAYLILNTINPDLVTPQTYSVPAGTSSSQSSAGAGPSQGGSFGGGGASGTF
ncbi:MAG TPA: hypothetical protein VMJ72_01625 [Candidatus Paceibacterota bacterium]|nr:hypothetical protein [Candidatus Paceibacterota bacterium]